MDCVDNKTKNVNSSVETLTDRLDTVHSTLFSFMIQPITFSQEKLLTITDLFDFILVAGLNEPNWGLWLDVGGGLITLPSPAVARVISNLTWAIGWSLIWGILCWKLMHWCIRRAWHYMLTKKVNIDSLHKCVSINDTTKNPCNGVLHDRKLWTDALWMISGPLMNSRGQLTQSWPNGDWLKSHLTNRS